MKVGVCIPYRLLRFYNVNSICVVTCTVHGLYVLVGLHLFVGSYVAKGSCEHVWFSGNKFTVFFHVQYLVDCL